MENKYNISYTPCSDMTGLITVLWIPLESWGEGKPIYTKEEANKVVEFIRTYKTPIPKDLGNWNSFRNKLNKDIYELYGK